MLTCTRCEKYLPEDAFSVNRAMETGRSRYCRSCTKEMNVERALLKPPGWTRKTADMAAYRREYDKKMRQESPEKIREKDREKYARKMQRLRGEGWKPRKRLDPEEASRRKKERDRAKQKRRYEMDKLDPEKIKKNKARKQIQLAVYRGKITPLPCEVCGEKAEAHHPSYDMPMVVTWLCRPHHRQAHAETKEIDAQAGYDSP